PPPVTGPSHPTLHLGLLDGAALQVIDLSALPERPPPDDGEAGESDLAPDLRLADGSAPVFRELRGVALAVEDAMAGAMAHAQALLNWHASHPLCPRCGAVTRIAAGGRHRHCANPACGADHFPRTDPVVIMLVEDPEGERCLLARQSRFPTGMYSALAGFVEPGETLEAAVAREVREEAGLEVGDIRYVASQPWPWPSNLMIGFIARARATALSLDDNELEDARWFTRAEVAAMGEVGDEGEGFKIPRRDAIARHLVEGWRDRRF
ncbi:NADH pyrophosphatase, partial [Rhodospirillum rubrum]|uniref:NAD(+) diphosphatase n=1 Tax=Rhodospirillum rubrum TaxID=1085 RepID=UPI001904B608